MKKRNNVFGFNFSTKTYFAFIFLLKDPLTILVMISHVFLSFVVINFIQHLAGKLILLNKSVISSQTQIIWGMDINKTSKLVKNIENTEEPPTISPLHHKNFLTH